MKRIVPLFLGLLVGTPMVLSAQRKSDLIAQIDRLESRLDSVQTELFDARKNEKASLVKAESLENQVNELQEANATLLTNLNNFAEVSNKNSDIANSAMENLQARERQLKTITDVMAKNDSTAIVVLTNAKQTLGENARIAVADGKVTLRSNLASLFTSEGDADVSEEGRAWLQKVANILAVNPQVALTVEGLSMTGDLELPARQATAVSSLLVQDFAVAPERITVRSGDGNLKEGINLIMRPDYEAFYQMVREDMKQ